MKILFAPLEGITGYTFRNVHHHMYGGISAYYTPFLGVRQTRKWNTRERKDIDPERNQGVPVVPQVLTNRGEDFLWAAENLRSLGYREINLNLGCPSATVVTKHKGAGFLEDPEKLDHFFEEIFSKIPDGLEVSVKTRLGLDSPEEMENLLPVFNRYPLKKLIVHPRTRRDFYTGPIHLRMFRMVYEESVNPVVYNGDLTTAEEVRSILEEFPNMQEVMIGRGLVSHPDLGEQIEAPEGSPADDANRTGRFRRFHDELLRSYQKDLRQDSSCLMKMKELWDYWAGSFRMNERDLRRLKKARTIEEYKACLPF